MLGTKRKYDFEPYWQDEKDWLCIVEFLPTDNPEARPFAADMIGYLVGYANLTNTLSLGLNPTFGSPHLGSPRGGRQTQLRESSMGNECSLRFVQSYGRSHSYELLSKRSRCPLRVEE